MAGVSVVACEEKTEYWYEEKVRTSNKTKVGRVEWKSW